MWRRQKEGGWGKKDEITEEKGSQTGEGEA